MPRNTIAVKRIYADMKELRTDPSDQYSAEPREDDLFDWQYVANFPSILSTTSPILQYSFPFRTHTHTHTHTPNSHNLSTRTCHCFDQFVLSFFFLPSFTLRGPTASDFEGGVYHGRILLPNDYPFKPPNIIFLTPNGRFEVRKKICLSISAYHPESWQPAWGIRTILEALISFFPTKGEGAVGALDWTREERQRLVPQSLEFCCRVCNEKNKVLIPKLKEPKNAENAGDSTTSSSVKTRNTYADQIAQMHMHAATGALAVASSGSASTTEETTGSGGTGGGSGSGTRTTRTTATTPVTAANVVRQRQNTQAAPAPAPAAARPTTTPHLPARVRSAVGTSSTNTSSGVSTSQRESANANGDSSVLLYVAVLLGIGVLFLLYRKINRAMGVVHM